MMLIVEEDVVEEDDAVDSELRQLLSRTTYYMYIWIRKYRSKEV